MADHDVTEPVVHPDFTSPADVTLISDDGTMFHVSSSQLAGASGWFRTLFSVPQGDAKRSADAHHIVLSEDTLTLEVVLKICCGRAPGLTKLGNLSDLERCLTAAEKYEAAGALDMLPLLLHKAHMQEDPLHLYALADRYGQEDVAASALKRLLNMRLNLETIEYLDYPQLRRLVARRQERIERFCSLLVQKDPAAPFYPENTAYCTRGSWTSFVMALQTAFIKQPSVEALESDKEVKAQLASLENISLRCALGTFDVEWSDIRLHLLAAMDAND